MNTQKNNQETGLAVYDENFEVSQIVTKIGEAGVVDKLIKQSNLVKHKTNGEVYKFEGLRVFFLGGLVESRMGKPYGAKEGAEEVPFSSAMVVLALGSEEGKRNLATYVGGVLNSAHSNTSLTITPKEERLLMKVLVDSNKTSMIKSLEDNVEKDSGLIECFSSNKIPGPYVKFNLKSPIDKVTSKPLAVVVGEDGKPITSPMDRRLMNLGVACNAYIRISVYNDPKNGLTIYTSLVTLKILESVAPFKIYTGVSVNPNEFMDL